MRVIGGGSSGGNSTFPPSGNLVIHNGGPNNAAPLSLSPSSTVWGEYQGASDDTGKTLILHTLSVAPRLKALLFDHSTGLSTELTLASFGTFSSAPNFHLAGYDIENDKYWICFSINGGSGSITVGVLYPLTISGSTITLGSGVTPPAIASKAVNNNGNCVNNGKIVQTYSDTGTFRIDTARVYDISGASWAAPAGGTVSPYAANTNATLDGNVPDEVAFASGAQNNKGYVSCNHANNAPVFIQFTFTSETFVDRSSQVPIQQDANQQQMWMMGLDLLGNYGVGFFKSSGLTLNTLFVYDTANDETISFMPLQLSANKSVLPGSESNGNLGWMMNAVVGTAVKGFKIPYINEPSSTSGTLAGAEAVGVGSNSDYGASDCDFLIKIDGSNWVAHENTSSLWSLGGFERFMQAYADSLEVIFVPCYQSGEFDLSMPPTIYYTN